MGNIQGASENVGEVLEGVRPNMAKVTEVLKVVALLSAKSTSIAISRRTYVKLSGGEHNKVENVDEPSPPGDRNSST